MVKNIFGLIKHPLVRNILIAWLLFYIISSTFSAQYMRNILGLPVMIWFVLATIVGVSRTAQAQRELVAEIQRLSGVTSARCADVCDNDALAVNYDTKSVHVIDDGKSKAFSCADVMFYEVLGCTYGPVSDTEIAGGGRGIIHACKRWLRYSDSIGRVKFWVNDAERSIITIVVSKKNIIDQLHHFALSNGMKLKT